MTDPIEFLEDNNIDYRVYNNGYQINIEFGDKEIVAFYPTTNKWVHRGKTYLGSIEALWNWVGEQEEQIEFVPPAPSVKMNISDKYVEVYLTRLFDGRSRGRQADLFTDGVDEFWIPHSQIDYDASRHIKGEDWELVITRWIAEQKEII